MSRKKKPLPLLEGIEISDYAAEGKALARVNDMVVFVPFAVPGDVVDLQVKKKKHNYCEAEIARIIKPSEKRIAPRCQHFGLCGGCKWQHVPYAEQLAMKQRQVHDQLQRIGKVELPEFMPILGSQQVWEYRNKLEFGCSNKRWLTPEDIATGREYTDPKDRNAIGFHITGAFDKILPIEECCLMDGLQNEIRNAIRDYALQTGMTFFDLRQQQGLLRDVMVRNSDTGEWMVLVQFHYDESGITNSTDQATDNTEGLARRKADEAAAMALLQHLADRFPQITSLLYVNNQKCNDTFNDLDIQVFKGNDHIFEIMPDEMVKEPSNGSDSSLVAPSNGSDSSQAAPLNGSDNTSSDGSLLVSSASPLRFKVGPKSFYQTNTQQAYHLYSVVRRFAGLTGSELVYDLYTGTGTIANFLARKAQRVVGIEYVPEAIEDAKINSEINGITNTLFYAGDMKDLLTDDFIAQHGKPDVIVTDPPRAGMHADVVDTILRTGTQRIVYVSCNPATQARDLQLMDAHYKVVAVQPVDMFPHTPHVENVVLLSKR